MSTIGLFVLFAVFIIVYIIMIEIFTVLFRLTGITKDKARTQVISLLTNSGFTTEESEIIMSARKRRTLAQITMLWGYSFSVLIVSVLVNIFLALNQSEIDEIAGLVGVLATVMIVMIPVMRLRWVKSHFDLLIEKIANRLMFGSQSNILVLIDTYREKAMVEAVVDHIPVFLDRVKLGDCGLKELYDIHILFIKRDGETLEVINGDTVLNKGDSLLLFGDYRKIREVFEHPERAISMSS